MTTPSGLIHSAWLLEHQVKDNQVVKLRPGLTVLILPQLRLRTSRAHSWVPQKTGWLNGFRNTASPLTPRSLQRSADIRYCVFYLICSSLLAKAPGNPIKICIPSLFFSLFLILKRLLAWTFPSSSLLFFFFPPPLPTCTFLNSPHPLPPSRPSMLMYQLQLTTSQVGLQDISEHRGAAGSLSASSLPPHLPLLPIVGSADVLSQAGQRDTWPNHRNTSSCRLLDAHHREKPGQRWRSSSGATTSPDARIRLWLQCGAVFVSFWLGRLKTSHQLFICDVIPLVLTCKKAFNQKFMPHAEIWTSFG